MKINITDIKEIEHFIEKIKEERSVLYQKLSFVNEHKFIKESDYLRDRINVINTIISELESVLSGYTKGIDVKFIWE